MGSTGWRGETVRRVPSHIESAIPVDGDHNAAPCCMTAKSAVAAVRVVERNRARQQTDKRSSHNGGRAKIMSGPNQSERRTKRRFFIEREVRYRVLDDDQIVDSGVGRTVNISSGGVAFVCDHELQSGSFLEVSISWPALLDNSCRMKLVAFGRVLRSDDCHVVTTIEKYEFRTQARASGEAVMSTRANAILRRWVEGTRKDDLKLGQFAKGEHILSHA